MPTFAVVIPNYNQSHFLPHALESLRHQSSKFNTAVMDGGSRDDLDSVLEAYPDVVSYVRSEKDNGQAAAIAEGVRMVQGDIFCWLNADDYYFPGALDRVAEVFQSHPEVDVVYGDAVHVAPDGSFLSYFPAIQPFDAKTLSRSCFICQPACFVRRAAYEAAGGVNPGLQYTMDWDLWCLLASKGYRFKYIQIPLAAVRCYPGTKTHSGAWQRYKEIWRIEKRYGRRIVPLTWPGFYRYDLAFRQSGKVRDAVLLKALDYARQIKKRVFSEKQKTIYGFYPWQGWVNGTARIQMPWYGKLPCRQFRIQVNPRDQYYRVQFNAAAPQNIKPDAEGFLTLSVPEPFSVHHVLDLRCVAQDSWELIQFAVEPGSACN